MKYYLPSLLLFILGCISFITYIIIGSYVDENGFLIEPFFLIPIGYLLLVLGVLYGLLTYSISILRKLIKK
jgi:hypothetical protein